MSKQNEGISEFLKLLDSPKNKNISKSITSNIQEKEFNLIEINTFNFNNKNDLIKNSENLFKDFDKIENHKLVHQERKRKSYSEVVANETFIYFYKDSPVFLDFLYNNPTNQKSLEYFELIKEDLIQKKWEDLNENEKAFYLYSKLQYFNLILENKENNKSKLELQIDDKNEEIKRLKLKINEITLQEQNRDKFQSEIMKKKENIEKLEKQISEFPQIISELDYKIKNCDDLIKNYENPIEGQPISEIIQCLKDENKILKNDINKQTENLAELDEVIKQLNGSIRILEMKSTTGSKK